MLPCVEEERPSSEPTRPAVPAAEAEAAVGETSLLPAAAAAPTPLPPPAAPPLLLLRRIAMPTATATPTTASSSAPPAIPSPAQTPTAGRASGFPGAFTHPGCFGSEVSPASSGPGSQMKPLGSAADPWSGMAGGETSGRRDLMSSPSCAAASGIAPS